MSAKANPDSKFAPEPKTKTDGKQMSFKQQLDQAAHDAREPDESSKQNPIVEKVTQYIPAAAKIFGNPQEKEDEKISRPGIPGPPERPYDDVQVEEFIRQQHRSKGENGVLE